MSTHVTTTAVTKGGGGGNTNANHLGKPFAGQGRSALLIDAGLSASPPYNFPYADGRVPPREPSRVSDHDMSGAISLKRAERLRPPEALLIRGITSVSSNGPGGVRLPKGAITRYFGRDLFAPLEVRQPKPEVKRRRYLGGEPNREGGES